MPTRPTCAARSLTILSITGMLGACVPFTSMPPPVPLADGSRSSIGVAYSQTFSDASWFKEEAYNYRYNGADIWLSVQRSERLTMSTRLSLGSQIPSDNEAHDVAALGGGMRIKINDGDRSFVGVDLSGGLVWVQVGLPLSVAVTDRIWLYTQPAIQVSERGSNLLPVGLSVLLGERLHLHAEVGRHAVQLPFGLLDLNPEQSLYAGAGVSLDRRAR